jgi:hypothetical protein
MQHVRRRIPACGDCSQYAKAVADVVGLHRRRRRPGVLWGDPNAQYAGADPEASACLVSAAPSVPGDVACV